MSELVVITGATGGVGRRLAHRLAERGFSPVIGHRSAKAEEAKQLAAACGGIAVCLDMADPAAIDAGILRIAEDGRPVAGAVLAASPPPVVAPFGKISPEEHALFWTANVVGPQRLLAGLVRQCFRPRKAGSVVGVLTKAMGSAHLLGGEAKAMGGLGAYTISKFGLLGVMSLAAAEFPWLHVASVTPGFIETDMLNAFDSRFLDLMRGQQSFSTVDDVADEIIERLNLQPASMT